jgi:hypothetical protein
LVAGLEAIPAPDQMIRSVKAPLKQLWRLSSLDQIFA